MLGLNKSPYVKCTECKGIHFQEITLTKLLIEAANAVKTAPKDTPVTAMYKEEAEVAYKCFKCGHVLHKDDIADQAQS